MLCIERHTLDLLNSWDVGHVVNPQRGVKGHLDVCPKLCLGALDVPTGSHREVASSLPLPRSRISVR